MNVDADIEFLKIDFTDVGGVFVALFASNFVLSRVLDNISRLFHIKEMDQDHDYKNEECYGQKSTEASLVSRTCHESAVDTTSALFVKVQVHWVPEDVDIFNQALKSL